MGHRRAGFRPEAAPYERWLFDAWIYLTARPDCPNFLPFKDFRRMASAGELPGYAPSDFSTPDSEVSEPEAMEAEPLF